MTDRRDPRIAHVEVTPLAFPDPPLHNSWGVHEPLALRAIVEVVTEGGVSGFGECGGDLPLLDALRAVADVLVGQSVFETSVVESLLSAALREREASAELPTVFSPIEVAMLDAQGRIVGRPVVDLLGGPLRDRVPFSGYLFYKWAGHPGEPDDAWGAALDPAGIVAQAKMMTDRYGFRSLKLKAGVFDPQIEIETILALSRAFPTTPLRIDPNGAWTVETALEVGRALGGVLEYLEDPVRGNAQLARVAAGTGLPIATNKAVVAFEGIAPALATGAVQVVLGDHHYWGGLRHSRALGAICAAFGLGLSMHSNSHLGISLAAMTHLAAAIPNLDFACDTHYPWNESSDVVADRSVIQFVEGAVTVPRGPGLGIEIDRGAVAVLASNYTRSGRRKRDDTAYARSVDPDFVAKSPRW